MIEKFLRGNKWQCRILGRGGEGVVNAMSCKPAAEIAFWQEWLGSERTRTISAAPGSFNSPLATIDDHHKADENFHRSLSHRFQLPC
jgi:hypothetical protein